MHMHGYGRISCSMVSRRFSPTGCYVHHHHHRYCFIIHPARCFLRNDGKQEEGGDRRNLSIISDRSKELLHDDAIRVETWTDFERSRPVVVAGRSILWKTSIIIGQEIDEQIALTSGGSTGITEKSFNHMIGQFFSDNVGSILSRTSSVMELSHCVRPSSYN